MERKHEEWADAAMFESAPTPQKPEVNLLWATPDPLGAIAAMCRMYEGKPTKSLRDIRDDEREHYWEQVNATHLKAPLESVKMHFFIQGVTRAFTHQMVRQRTAVYAQESLRFAVKERMAAEAQVPISIAGNPSRENAYFSALASIQRSYNELIADGVPAEDARGLLPHCTTTRIHYVTDLRNLLEHAGNRLCTQAQFEWRAVFLGIMEVLREHESVTMDPNVDLHPRLWNWQWRLIVDSDVFRPICYAVGRCPFMAVFDRQCTIRERVNKGEFDKIDPSEYLADPTAGRRD